MIESITAEEYRKLVGAEEPATPTEMSAEEYRKLVGLDEPLLAPKTNTEPKAKRDFASWLERVSPDPIFTEHQFHPTRKWRFDFCIPQLMLAFEYDGLMQHGRNQGHASIGGILRDSEKLNEAQSLGWVVVRVNAKTVSNKSAFAMARRAFALRGVEIP